MAFYPPAGPPKGPPDDESIKMYRMYPDKGETSSADYDPHEHRQVAHPTSNWDTLVHLLKGSLGTGILAMPKAFMNAGLVVGLIGTILIGSLCTYCLHLLVKCQYKLCKRFTVPVLNYPDSMVKALEVGPEFLRRFSKPSSIVVDFFLVVYQLGICCVYIVFIAENIRKVVENAGYPHMSVRWYMLTILVPLVLINYIRNLKWLSPFSAIANLITFVGLGIIIYYLFNVPLDASPLPFYNNALLFPLFVGTTLFALEAVGVVIALENNMATPKSFGGAFGVLNIGMSIIVFLYAFIGFFGYIRYGLDSKDSVTLNLDPKAVLTQVVLIIFALAILITYALQSFVPVEVLWKTYLGPRFEKSPRKNLYEYLLRTGLVLLTFLLAVAIPNLGVFISLFGAFCLSMLGITFPGLIDICVRWPDGFGKFRWRLVRDISLICLGLLALLVGTYSSVVEIIKAPVPAP